MARDVIGMLRRGLVVTQVVYGLPGVVSGAPKRNVILLLIYLLASLIVADLVSATI